MKVGQIGPTFWVPGKTVIFFWVKTDNWGLSETEMACEMHMQCTCHFRFGHFYIVDIHSALNFQVSVWKSEGWVNIYNVKMSKTEMACAPPKTCQNQKSFWIPSNQSPNTCGAWSHFFFKNSFSWNTLRYMGIGKSCYITERSANRDREGEGSSLIVKEPKLLPQIKCTCLVDKCFAF